jgi:integrase
VEALFGTVRFYTPSTKLTDHTFEIRNKETELIYYAQDGIELDDPDYGVEVPVYYNFPFVLNKDGSLWKDATLFFIWKLKQNPYLSAERLRQYADPLQDFKRFCEMMEEKEVDESEERRFHYLKAPIKSRRPNVMYGKYLAENRAKQWGEKMKKVSAFYRYLIDVRGVRFHVDMLETVKQDKLIRTTGGGGFLKEVSFNNVDREAKTQNQNDDHIRDGDKMRPMSIAEQKAFETAIVECKNEELVLGVMIAITSMARKQTVYTLRIRHLIDSLPVNYDRFTLKRWKEENLRTISDDDEFKIKVGDGTGADTKNGKRFYIMIAGWLRKAIIKYIVSDRAKNRRENTLSQHSDLDQYVFLSRDHNPFYHAKDDINLKAWKEGGRKPMKGNGIDQAMKRFRDDDLTYMCAKLKCSIFPIRFHDLRATGGMRYLDRNEHRVDGKIVTWGTVLRELSKLMAHESTTTTQRYLDFKLLMQEAIPQLQFDFEKERMAKIRERTRYSY